VQVKICISYLETGLLKINQRLKMSNTLVTDDSMLRMDPFTFMPFV